MGITIINKKTPNFRSPVDGTPITSRRKLEEHNRRNNVVNTGEFGENDGKKYFERKQKEREESLTNPKAREERKRDIAEAIDKTQKR